MYLIVCADDRSGILFNHRRLSMDRVVREDILAHCAGKKLWVDEYTASQFDSGREQLTVDEDCLTKAGEREFCFVEREDLTAAEKPEGVVVYRWNRRYPADRHLPEGLLSGLTLSESRDFPGYSHEKITKEIYERRT